jgi:tryptophan synthase alpha chain
MNARLAETFRRLRETGRPGLVTYVTAGDPDLPRSRDILLALQRGGADVIEVGVPFSDPLADGPVIQRAVERALAAGATLTRTLELIGGLRADLRVPVVLFTYVNPVLRLGVEAFAERAAGAGVDGVLVLDLPVEEAAPLHGSLDRVGLDTIFLLSPTTTPARMREAARLGRGFLYAISRLGVTGARDTVEGDAPALCARIREVTDLPIALGFGLSRPEQVAEATRYADAAVVGSAIVDRISRSAASEAVDREVETIVRWLRRDIDGEGTTGGQQGQG